MTTVTEPGVYHYREAERLLLDCQLAPSIERDPATYPATEDGKNTICNALAAAQVHATLAVAAALGALKEPNRAALNDWYEE